MSNLTEGGGGFGRVGEREVAVAPVVGLRAICRIGGRLGDLYADQVPVHDYADLLCVFFVHPWFKISP